ncbi:MAG: hypothetical protein AAFX93_19880 [Verrucomicrobiota bacterium]
MSIWLRQLLFGTLRNVEGVDVGSGAGVATPGSSEPLNADIDNAPIEESNADFDLDGGSLTDLIDQAHADEPGTEDVDDTVDHFVPDPEKKKESSKEEDANGESREDPGELEAPIPEEDQESYGALSEDSQSAVQSILVDLASRADEATLSLTEAQEQAIAELPEADQAAVREFLEPYLGEMANADDGAEDETEPEGEGKGKLDEKTQAILNKRINKEVAKRKDLEEALTASNTKLVQFEAKAKQAEARAAELESRNIVPAPTRKNPLSTMTTIDDLERYESEAEQFLDWLDENPDGGECALVNKAFSAEDIAPTRRTLERQLRAVPDRRAYLETEASVEQHLTRELPELGDPNSAISQSVAKVLSAVPELKQKPNYKVDALVYTIGFQLANSAGGVVEALKMLTKTQQSPTQGGGRRSVSTAKKTTRSRKVVPKPMPVMGERKPAPIDPKVKRQRQRKDVPSNSDEIVDEVAELLAD